MVVIKCYRPGLSHCTVIPTNLLQLLQHNIISFLAQSFVMSHAKAKVANNTTKKTPT